MHLIGIVCADAPRRQSFSHVLILVLNKLRCCGLLLEVASSVASSSCIRVVFPRGREALFSSEVCLWTLFLHSSPFLSTFGSTLVQRYSQGRPIGPPQGPFWRPDRGWGFTFHCGLKWRTLGGHTQVKFPSSVDLGRPLCNEEFRVPCEAPGGGCWRTASVISPCRHS